MTDGSDSDAARREQVASRREEIKELTRREQVTLQRFEFDDLVSSAGRARKVAGGIIRMLKASGRSESDDRQCIEEAIAVTDSLRCDLENFSLLIDDMLAPREAKR